MTGSLLVIGAGGHGRVVADAAEVSGCWSEIAFLDDRHPGLGSSGRWPVIGTLEGSAALAGNWGDCVVAIGDNTVRLESQAKMRSLGLTVTTVIHPSAQIASDVVLGEGSVVFANAVINTGSVLGSACIVNTGSTVDHDCLLGDGVHISPGVNLAGNVEVGARCWVGIGATVIHGCAIGDGVMIAAGAVVTNNIDSGLTVAGIPARELVR
jgi:sugar O-acyltransferase (sialic acid O-acetyltransferase NeuD family)